MMAPPPVTRRVLILKLGAIGDVVMTVPAAHLLHQSGYAIDWVCSTVVAPLLQRYDWINAIAVDEALLRKGNLLQRLGVLAKLWKRLLPVRYELCACLYYDTRYRLVSLPVRARVSLMLSHVDRDRMLLKGRHHTDEYARVMMTALTGVPDGERTTALAPVPFPLPTPPRERTLGAAPRIVLCPGGAKNALRDDPLRRWPIDRYVELATRLVDRGAEVVLIGGPDDAWVTPSFGALPVENRVGRLSLNETLGLLDTADVLVTHDTGPLHLGGLTSVAIVGLFGPTDPRMFLPRRPSVVGLWGGERFACRPCYDGRDFAPCRHNGCLTEVGVDAVMEALSKTLGNSWDGSGPRSVPIEVIRRS